MPAVEEIATMRPERWARMTGRTARVTFIGPNIVVSTCARNSSRRDLLKKPGVEVARIINENVDPAEPVDGGARGVLGVVETRNVELNDEELVVGSERGADPLRVASGGDDCVARGQSGLRDVDAHTATRAGNEPDLLVNVPHLPAALAEMEIYIRE